MTTDPMVDTPVRERTVAAVMDKQVALRPDKVALVDIGGRSLTYQELQHDAFRVANSLGRMGIGRQEQVLVLLGDHIDHVVLWLGTTIGAMVEVPINTAFKGEMLRYVIEYSGASVLVIEGEWCDRLSALDDGAPELRTIVVHGTENAPVPERFRRASFEDLLTGETVRPEPPEVWDVSSMLFTSGTEGRSKGVLCPHGHTFPMASYPLITGSDEVVLVALPLFHAAGLWSGVYNALRVGGTAVLAGTFSATKFWQQIREYNCTTTTLLGAMATFLWNQPESPDDRSHGLKLAAVVPAPAIAKEFTERFGVTVTTAYGLTEAGTFCVATADDVRPRGCGRPRSYVDVRLVDENDIDVNPGEVGEIVVRSKEPWSLMLGYHRMPEETVHAFRNLWLHSGDCAYQDDSGQYFFVDRRKDALRRRGENISSFEVERMIISRSDIAEAAVIGVPSEHTEEEMMVFLKLTPGALFDPERLLHDLSERMPYFMVPRYYEVVESFPMTPTHKVQKKALRERGVGEATWDYHAAGFRVSRDGLIRLEQALSEG